MVGLVHFSNFLILSEKYYKLQSCWITLYIGGLSWETAENACKEKGGHLASITTLEKKKYAKELLEKATKTEWKWWTQQYRRIPCWTSHKVYEGKNK